MWRDEQYKGEVTQIAKDLMKKPAYLDESHPAHDATVKEVMRLFEEASRGGPAQRYIAPPSPETKKLMKHPAYTDRNHPEHDAIVAKVSRGFGINPNDYQQQDQD
jgi:hypothetical protein